MRRGEPRTIWSSWAGATFNLAAAVVVIAVCPSLSGSSGWRPRTTWCGFGFAPPVTPSGAPGRKRRRDRRWGSKAEPSRSERSRRMRGAGAARNCTRPMRRRRELCRHALDHAAGRLIDREASPRPSDKSIRSDGVCRLNRKWRGWWSQGSRRKRFCDGRRRRIVDVADRRLGRLNWARKRTYRDRKGRRGVRPERKFRLVSLPLTSQVDSMHERGGRGRGALRKVSSGSRRIDGLWSTPL